MEILRKIKSNNRRKLMIGSGRFLLWLLVVALAVVTSIVVFWGTAKASANILLLLHILLVAIPLSLLAGAVIHWLYRMETIQDLDRRCNGKNRLEAAVELHRMDNPFKQMQHEQTERFYQDANPYPKNYSLHRLAFTLLLAVCVTALVFLSLIQTGMAAQNGASSSGTKGEGSGEGAGSSKDKGKGRQDKDKNGADDGKPSRNEIGMLVIASPEAEIRSKPMDIIHWQGKAEAARAFNKVRLHLYRNAEEKLVVDLDQLNYFRKNKDDADAGVVAQLNGEFTVDQLNALPYDLISYHLSGEVVLNGKPTRVLSTPHFIEVRPYREETFESDLASLRAGAGGGGRFDRMLDLVGGIHRTIKMQLSLNKALFVVRASGLSVDEKELRSQLRLLCQDQQQLQKEMRQIIKAAKKEKLPESLIENLQEAVTQMGRSSLELEKCNDR